MNSIKSKFDAIMQEALSQIPDLDIDSGFDPHEEPIEVWKYYLILNFNVVTYIWKLFC